MICTVDAAEFVVSSSSRIHGLMLRGMDHIYQKYWPQKRKKLTSTVHIHKYIDILDKWENMPVVEDIHAGHTGTIMPDRKPGLPGVLHEAQSHWCGSVWGT